MCPTPERLVEMVEGRLDPAAQLAIEEHIDTCESCRVGLAAAVRGDDAPKGWTLGRYRIDDVIGSGGMGIVYRAWDPSLSREVAIKVVKSDDADLRARLAREARSMARLNHRNVCQIYDVGTDDAELWIAMELVRGTTLRAWAAGKPDSPESRDEVLAVLVDAGRGLAAAHAAGLVHRDVKPENILVDRDGRAVVSDFGLARDLDDRVTRTSALAGTPAYMAPEQLDGAPADARSDQYAFAVTAHEVLTGGRPRPRNQASATLPPPLRAALDRALSDAPDARFDSIADLVDAFIAPPMRPRARVLVIGAALLALVAFGAGGMWLYTHRPAAYPDASDAPAPPRPVASRDVAAPAPSAAIDRSPSAPPPSTPADRSPSTPPPSTPADRSPSAPPPSTLADRSPSAPAPSAPAIAAPRGGSAGPAGTRPVQVASAPANQSTPPAKQATAGGDVGTHVAAMQQAVVAGDGTRCTTELAAIDQMKLPDPLVKPMMQLRGQCLMLAGQCEAGKQAARTHWQSYNFTAENVERSVDLDVSLHCRSGTRSERDRLLRAMFVLGDANYKHTLAECRDAYAEAKPLVGKVPSRGSMDMLDDAKDRFASYAPGCFARAGDCPTAWRIAKELDAAARADSTDFTKRSAFVHAVGALCADQDQGTLSDVEIVWRSIVELDRVHQAGTRTAAYCTTRIDRGLAALRRLGEAANAERLPDKLADEGASCLAATGDCAAAWQRYAEIASGDEATQRRRFDSAVRACKGD